VSTPRLPAEGETAHLARTTLEPERPGHLVQGPAVGEDIVDDKDPPPAGPAPIGHVEDGAELFLGDPAYHRELLAQRLGI